MKKKFTRGEGKFRGEGIRGKVRPRGADRRHTAFTPIGRSEEKDLKVRREEEV